MVVTPHRASKEAASCKGEMGHLCPHPATLKDERKIGATASPAHLKPIAESTAGVFLKARMEQCCILKSAQGEQAPCQQPGCLSVHFAVWLSVHTCLLPSLMIQVSDDTTQNLYTLLLNHVYMQWLITVIVIFNEHFNILEYK